MYFVILGTDRPGMTELRLATRPAHREYLHNPTSPHRVRLLHGGPTLTPDGEQMNGTLLVVEAASLADAEHFAANDPYRKAGLFESVAIRPWAWATGRPEQT